MSLSADKMREMTELSMLGVDDARRMRFVEQLSGAEEGVRAYWKLLEREEEILRAGARGVAGGPVAPREMMAGLLAIPMRASMGVKGRSWREVTVPRPVAAGVLMAVLGLGGYWYWKSDQPPQIVMLPAAPMDVVAKVMTLAVNYHVANAGLDVRGSDAGVVMKALQSEVGGRLAFGVELPAVGVEFHLEGGSVMPFGKGMAVYTRWERGGEKFSLYQFSPESVGLPREFSKLVEMPVTKGVLGKGDFVSMWPGTGEGVSAWASVRDGEGVAEPFSGCRD